MVDFNYSKEFVIINTCYNVKHYPVCIKIIQYKMVAWCINLETPTQLLYFWGCMVFNLTTFWVIFVVVFILSASVIGHHKSFSICDWILEHQSKLHIRSFQINGFKLLHSVCINLLPFRPPILLVAAFKVSRKIRQKTWAVAQAEVVSQAFTKGWERRWTRGLHFKMASEVQKWIIELYILWLIYCKNHRKNLANCKNPCTFTTNSHEARSFTRPNTTIWACHTTQKKHLLKPA